MGVLLSNTPIVQIKEIKPNKRITHCVAVGITFGLFVWLPKIKIMLNFFQGSRDFATNFNKAFLTLHHVNRYTHASLS